MAFLKFAKATLQKPGIKFAEWDALRRTAILPEPDFQKRTARVILQEYDPSKYMLSHATIVASVDVNNASAPVGRHFVDGFEINRQHQDYYITPQTTRFINNNFDGFERKLLLASFKTFVGAQSYIEHVQIPELSQGRIIDAAARDIGDSVYVDILIANDLKHAALIRSIKSGQLGTLSMGCFVPGTRVTVEHGNPKRIEDVAIGEQVLTQQGRYREVTAKQVKIGSFSMKQIHVLGVESSIVATDNHPFFVRRQKGLVEVRADWLTPGDFVCAPKAGENHGFLQVRSVESLRYVGPVHDMTVDEDHSYVVEGLAVHNCSTSSTTCSKCGNVAKDESQLCACVRYFKGHAFVDEYGTSRKVAELCFPPGTRVVMSDGSRRDIATLQQGDMVISHRGTAREVTTVFTRSFVGEMVALDIEGVPQTIRATAKHPFWAMRVRSTCACGCGGQLPRPIAFSVEKFRRQFLPGHNNYGTAKLEIPAFEFVAADKLLPGDRLAMPIITAQRVPDNVTAKHAELLGWFLAEGCFLKQRGERRGVSFTLNAEDEIPVAKRLAELLEQCFPPEWRDCGIPQLRAVGKRNGTDVLLELVSKAPMTSDEIRKLIPGFQQTVLNRYAKLGKISSRPLMKGERLDIVGRKRSRARVWEAIPGASSRRSDAYAIVSERRLEEKRQQRVRCYAHVYVHERSEGGRKLVVAYNNYAAADWLFQHAGEYADSKRLSDEALYWPPELQKVLLKGYVRGDGTIDKVARTNAGSVSEVLISQLQLVAARCGIWARRQVTFEGRSVQLAQVVGGDTVPVGDNHFKPLHSLHFRPADETTAFFGFELIHQRAVGPKWRQQSGYMMYTVRKVSRFSYEGAVHNLSVEEDESYLVEGLATHNCGHFTDPNSVRFIEASWVANPAFKGAVLRGVLSAETGADVGAKLHMAFSKAAPAPIPGGVSKAARALLAQGEQQTQSPAQQAPTQGQAPAQEEAPAQAQAPAPAPGAAPPADEDPIDKAVKDLSTALRDKAIEHVRQEISKGEVDEVKEIVDNNKQNESLIRSALEHSAWRRVARFVVSFVGKSQARSVLRGLILHKHGGWRRVKQAGLTGREILAVSRVLDVMTKKSSMAGETRVYRTVLSVGGTAPYEDDETYLAACRQALGRVVTGSEASKLLEKGRLYALGRS